MTGEQVQGEALSVIPLYHYYPLYRHCVINQALIAKSSRLHMALSRLEPGTLGFRVHVANHYANQIRLYKSNRLYQSNFGNLNFMCNVEKDDLIKKLRDF